MLASPVASFLITLVEGAPRKLLFKVNTVQALILGSTILVFVYWRSFRTKKKKSCKTSSSH
jgi:hypothetical protein